MDAGAKFILILHTERVHRREEVSLALVLRVRTDRLAGIGYHF
jgi:hypothetical protein